MIVYWATKLRGFFRHMSERMDGVEFTNDGKYYETSKLSAKLKSKLIRSKLLDPIGLFQVVRVSEKACDAYGSFNRFLDSDKPYFLYLENPTALYHYSLGRISFPAGKKRFNNCLNNPRLRHIVCMSDACRNTFETVNMPVPAHLKISTIYPFVPQNVHVKEELLISKTQSEVLECMYCVQGKRFVTKGGLDVLTAFSNIRKSGCKVHLTVITKISDLDKKTRRRLENCDGVTLLDFNLSYDELEKKYANTSILLHPSSDDSFGLTVLEAMKGGCAIIASRLYAFSEMVEHEKNGLLIEPKYWMFTPDNLPNPAAWTHRKKQKHARKRDPQFVQEIEEAIKRLYFDRNKLLEYARKSVELADTKFGEETICGQWEDVWASLRETES